MNQRLISVYPPDTRKGAGGVDVEFDVTPQNVVVTHFRSTDHIETGQVPNIIATTPSKIVGAQPSRRVCTLRNEGAVDVYIGPEGVTIATGFRIGVGQSLTLETGGEIWGVSPSGSGTLHWLAEVEAAL